MYTQEQFFQLIEERTGWKHGSSDGRLFGFIHGTVTPYQVQGLASARNRPGFIIWKKESVDKRGVEETITDGTPEEMLNKIVDFLNRPFPTT